MADCDSWPFPGLEAKFAMADFDAYEHPYPAFEAFWENAQKQDRLVMFFTDGHRQAILRLGIHVHPDGSTTYPANLYERQRPNYFYLTHHVWPYLEDKFGTEWRVLERQRYTRQTVTYHGIAIERGRPRTKLELPEPIHHGSPKMVPKGAESRVAISKVERKAKVRRERERVEEYDAEPDE
jgi:hypothetical protein